MIEALIARLRDQCGSFLHDSIEYAWDSEPTEIKRDDLPKLFTFPGDEATADDGTSDIVSRRLQREAHIYLVCQIDDLEDLKTETRSAVIGWNPGAADGYDDMQLVSGRMVNLKGGVVWWEDIYTTWRTIREVY